MVAIQELLERIGGIHRQRAYLSIRTRLVEEGDGHSFPPGTDYAMFGGGAGPRRRRRIEQGRDVDDGYGRDYCAGFRNLSTKLSASPTAR